MLEDYQMMIPFVKSQLSSAHQQDFERILNEAKQVVHIASQNPVILKDFLRENMIQPTIFYATAMLLTADIIQSMRTAQALAPIWFDQLYELTNLDARNALTSCWQQNFINRIGVSYERGQELLT